MGIYVVKDPGTLEYGIIDPSRSFEIIEGFRRIDVKFMSPMTSDTIMMSLVIIESDPDFIYTQGPFKMIRSRKLPFPEFPPEIHTIRVYYMRSSINDVIVTACRTLPIPLPWTSSVHNAAAWMFGKYIVQ